ncbi:MAG: CRISPR-associated endonuclease Cas1 [Anaerolineae bacterium]|nr:CRISPR-associated endonuclease Cas1 [Anaerolineae bacterium]
MATLYVTEPGARIEKEYRRILVTKQDEVLMAVPLGRLSEVVLVGQVGATTPALLMLLDEGIALSFVTRAGTLRGRLTPPSPKNLPLRHAQYERARDADFCLAVARAIVDGKLRNSRALAYRIRRSHPQTCGERRSADSRAIAARWLERIEGAVEAVAQADDMDSLRGIEGAAAKAYFQVLREGLRPEMTFEKRTRRPPRDPANALLSFGYTLLTQNLITACEVVGLDPYDGFFHADKYGRPALALDLVEEFRGPVVDSVVQLVINKRIIGPDDFEPGPEGGIYLSDRALRKFLRQYTQRLNTCIIHPHYGRRLTYQRVFEAQARLLAKTVQGELDKYPPFRVR